MDLQKLAKLLESFTVTGFRYTIFLILLATALIAFDTTKAITSGQEPVQG
jgi:hypothetical protein